MAAPFPQGGGWTSLGSEGCSGTGCLTPCFWEVLFKTFPDRWISKRNWMPSVLGIPWLISSTWCQLHPRAFLRKTRVHSEQMARWQELFPSCELSPDPDSASVRHTAFLRLPRIFSKFLFHSLRSSPPNPHPVPVSQLIGEGHAWHFLLHTWAISLMSVSCCCVSYPPLF